MTLIENIEGMYSQINKKGKFQRELAKELGKSTNTLKNHWFRFFEIPEKYQERTVEMMQRTIANQ